MKRRIVFFIVISTLWVVSMNAQGTFIKRPVDLNFNGACSVHSSDINNDGREDILGAASGSNQLAWWENDGSVPPQFIKHIIEDNFLTAIYIYPADVNGDSIPDVLGAAWTGNQVALWINDGGNPGTWTKQVIDPGFTQAHEVKTANIDGTGGTDIVAASAGNNEIAWWQNGGGTPIVWNKYSISTTVYGARSVFPVDIDNDNDCDVIAAAFTSNQVILFKNEGGNPIQWTQEIVDYNLTGAHWVHSCDIDNDDDPDILGAGYMSGDIAIWFNNGGNPLQWNKFILESNLTGALSVVSDDLNNDNWKDIIAAGDQAGDVITWYNQGGTPLSFSKVTLEPGFPGAWPVHTCDLDNDADHDILSASSTMNDIYWWDNQLITTDVSEFPANETRQGTLSINPNPFKETTEFRFFISEEAEVSLLVLSVTGKIVKSLLRGKSGPGNYLIKWDGRDDAGNLLKNGVYVCILREKGIFMASNLLIRL